MFTLTPFVCRPKWRQSYGTEVFSKDVCLLESFVPCDKAETGSNLMFSIEHVWEVD